MVPARPYAVQSTTGIKFSRQTLSLSNWTLTTSESRQYFIDWIGRTIHSGNPTPIARYSSNPSLCGPIDNWRRALSAPQGSSPTDEYASQVTGLSKYRLSTSRESYCFSADFLKAFEQVHIEVPIKQVQRYSPTDEYASQVTSKQVASKQVEILTAFHVHIGAPIEQVQRSSPTNRYASQLTGKQEQIKYKQ